MIKALKSLAKEYSSKVGCVDLLLDNTTGMKLESQRATVESWVTQQVDAIVLWPVDSTAFAGLQKQAQSQGTKWLTYLTSMDGQDGNVGFDNKLQGEQIAADVTEWIEKNYPPDGGATAAVTTLTTLPPSRPPRYELPIKPLKRPDSRSFLNRTARIKHVVCKLPKTPFASTPICASSLGSATSPR